MFFSIKRTKFLPKKNTRRQEQNKISTKIGSPFQKGETQDLGELRELREQLFCACIPSVPTIVLGNYYCIKKNCCFGLVTFLIVKRLTDFLFLKNKKYQIIYRFIVRHWLNPKPKLIIIIIIIEPLDFNTLVCHLPKFIKHFIKSPIPILF